MKGLTRTQENHDKTNLVWTCCMYFWNSLIPLIMQSILRLFWVEVTHNHILKYIFLFLPNENIIACEFHSLLNFFPHGISPRSVFWVSCPAFFFFFSFPFLYFYPPLSVDSDQTGARTHTSAGAESDAWEIKSRGAPERFRNQQGKTPRSPVPVASFDQNILLFGCFFCRTVPHPFFGCIRGYISSKWSCTALFLFIVVLLHISFARLLLSHSPNEFSSMEKDVCVDIVQDETTILIVSFSRFELKIAHINQYRSILGWHTWTCLTLPSSDIQNHSSVELCRHTNLS